jgi:hypothetical protein
MRVCGCAASARFDGAAADVCEPRCFSQSPRRPRVLRSAERMNRADRWLHGELRAIGRWRNRWLDGDWRAIGGGGIDSRDDVVAERLEGARAGLEALGAAGAVSAASASRWRVVFAREAGGERRVVAGPEVGARAERFLAGLLETLPPGVEGDVADVLRFEAAVEVFSAVGAADGREWYARLRERRSGEEERAEELGGTEAELIEVIPGPGEVRRGHRLLLVLRFADGVSLMVDRRREETLDDDWPGWG